MSTIAFGEEASDPFQDQMRIKFTGHERDLGNPNGTGDDLDYMHARFCSPITGRFTSVDPEFHRRPTTTPQRLNRYAYAHNNPLLKVDPDGRDALAVTFVGYGVGTQVGRLPLGHSGITISKNGLTRYYEYGRYEPGGAVRYRGPFSNFELGANGLPTKASLKKYLSQLTSVVGQNRPVESAYFINDQPDAMLDFLQERREDPSKQGAYDRFSNNCATFTEDVLEAGDESLDVSFINTPNNVMQELQDVADFTVSYDPENDELTVKCDAGVCPN
ncbi:MAG: RHS repeat-associated core domain-containing protein [bacterium]|nr:RHS repeat-associated core domain-containing protein [bacterium]